MPNCKARRTCREPHPLLTRNVVYLIAEPKLYRMSNRAPKAMQCLSSERSGKRKRSILQTTSASPSKTGLCSRAQLNNPFRTTRRQEVVYAKFRNLVLI